MEFSPEDIDVGALVGLTRDLDGRAEVATLPWRARGFSLRTTLGSFARAALFTNTPRARLELPLPPGAWTLVFVRHDWSGHVLVRDASRYSLHDLYGPPEDKGTYELTVDSGGPDTPIVLELAPQRNPKAQGAEMWLLEVRQPPTRFYPERGAAVTEVCRLIDGRLGKFLALRTDIGVPEQLAATGEWEQQQVELFARLVRAGEAALDVGANIGLHSVALSQLVGEDGKVVAFEPQMQMYNLLNANLVLNRCRNVLPLRVAVGKTADKLRMIPVSYDEFIPFGALGVQIGTQPADHRGEMVDVVRLDDLMPSLDLGERRVSLMKIDVQSYELFVFEGAREFLRRELPSISFEVSPFWMRHRGYDWRDILALLEELGYSFFDEAAQPLATPQWDGQSEIEWQLLAVHPRYRSRIA
jgi:FkbM family methyltransferase